MFCCEGKKIGQIFMLFCVIGQINEGQKVFLSFDSVFRRYLKSILLKFCILVYNLEIKEICCNFDMTKFAFIFGVNSISPEIMVM